MPTTYSQAGVSIDEGERLVELIKRPVRSTFTKGVIGDIGGFGALFDARFRKYKSPVLVSSVDGVGTKLRVAQLAGRHNTIGQDLVNHCVNDILTCGARPLFFLDYFATGRLNADVASQVVGGFVRACRENGCSLIGGETAEMPGFYQDNDYDVAGTIVGVVERKRIMTGEGISKGNVIIGLPSTGLHTNGYSLARSVLLKVYAHDTFVDELGTTVGDALLAVHRSYLHIISSLLKRFDIRGLAHITGGGLEGNTVRIVPRGLAPKVDWEAWERPALFRLIQRLGEVPEEDMRRTFNLGIGFVIVAGRKSVDRIVSYLLKKGERPVVVGEIVRKGKKRKEGK